MFEYFECYIRQHVPKLTPEEINRIGQAAIMQKLPKKHLLIQAGEIYRYKILVLKGLLRNYSVGEDGTEYIMKFTPEQSWTTDSESYNKGTPSKYYVQAIEETEVMMWSHADFEHLRVNIPAINAFSESMMLSRINETQQRLLTSISASAEEKYADFISSYPGVARRIPLHMIASYLGVSRETLTRIRHAQLTR
ncbi:Crp/Fnr family transcriptional regulator [Mucilaginibacter sp.]